VINASNIKRGIRNPSLFAVLLRRLFPWRALRNDPECGHLIKSWSSGTLPHRPLNQIFPGVEKMNVTLRTPYGRVVGTSTDLGEVASIAAVMKLIGARRVLEIGTADGFNALNLAANLSEGDALVNTLDLPLDEAGRAEIGPIQNAIDPSVTGRRFGDQPEAARIRQFFGDSTALDWNTLGGPFDLIFIDGSHEYDFVVKDTASAFANLAPGGVIFWHDYGIIPDVSKAVDERAKSANIVAIQGTRLAVYRA
jgi:predicted O-methyltransferase YrrM